MKKLLVAGIFIICVSMVTMVPYAVSAEKAQPKVRFAEVDAVEATMPYGGYIGAWKQEGLDVEVKRFMGGPASIEAIMAGESDVATTGYVGAIMAAGKGLPLYFVASEPIATKEYPFFVVTVNPNSKIKSFKELKGKKVAIHMRGTPQELLLRLACEKYGMRWSDLDLVLVPWPQQGGVLAHNQVDATFPFPPYEALQEFNKQGRVIWNASEVIEYMGLSSVVISRKFANSYPEATQKILKGFIRACRWIDDNQALAREKVITDQQYFIPPVAPEIAKTTRFGYYPRNGLHVMPGIWNTYYQMVKTNMIKPFDHPEAVMKEYFIDPTMKYTVPALKELGVSQDPYIYRMTRTPMPYLAKKPEAYFAPWEMDDAGLIVGSKTY
jgi:sulfonate transport system substrate-binding protein